MSISSFQVDKENINTFQYNTNGEGEEQHGFNNFNGMGPPQVATKGATVGHYRNQGTNKRHEQYQNVQKPRGLQDKYLGTGDREGRGTHNFERLRRKNKEDAQSKLELVPPAKRRFSVINENQMLGDTGQALDMLNCATHNDRLWYDLMSQLHDDFEQTWDQLLPQQQQQYIRQWAPSILRQQFDLESIGRMLNDADRGAMLSQATGAAVMLSILMPLHLPAPVNILNEIDVDKYADSAFLDKGGEFVVDDELL